MRLESKKLKTDFIKKVEDLSGQNLYACYQCGKCSAGCPIVENMDILPHTVIRLLQLGADSEALDSRAIWLCSSCLQCMAKCPKGVDLAKIMDTLRTVLLRKGIDKIELKDITSELWKSLPQQALVARFRKFSP